MNILICPDSFKGTATSIEAANFMALGVEKVFPAANITKLSVSDGGEGTVESILHNCEGEKIECKVHGPNGKQRLASYALLKNGTAFIEMAEASGLILTSPKDRNSMTANTYGTGEMIKSALDFGCKNIVIGIGGSATTDGGTGMARALGYRFLTESGDEITYGGIGLLNLKKIDNSGVDKRIFDVDITVACDVNNPLYSNNGAAYVYAPQKGATREMVKQLDMGLMNLDRVVQNDMELDCSEIPGAGAAGGLGYGLMVFCGAHLQSGITTMLDMIGFDDYLKNCDLIITGEGRIDGQSINGKVPVGIGERAKKRAIPVVVIAGGIGDQLKTVYKYGISSVMVTVNCAMTLSEALKKTKPLMIEATERVMRMIKVGMDISKDR